MKRFNNVLANNWQPFIYLIIGISSILTVLWYELASLTRGVSLHEQLYVSTHANLRHVLDNPINIVHGTLTAIPQLFNIHSLLLLRFVSALVALVVVLSFFLVVRAWHTTRVAVFSTFLFTTSAWFLHFARIGSPEISYLSLICILFFGTWVQSGKNTSIATLGLIISGVLSLYTPGMVWIVLPALFWQRKRIYGAFARITHWVKALCFITPIILLIPMAFAAVQQPSLIRTILGLPNEFPPILTVFKNLIHIPISLIYRSSPNQVLWLGRLPLLDIFAIGMLAMGVYVYWFKRGLDRTKLMLWVLVVTMILVSFGGPVELITILPIIYLFIAAAISLLLQQWFKVFPRNPIARITGIVLLTTTIALTGFYNLKQYFVAWPNAPETKSAFSYRFRKY